MQPGPQTGRRLRSSLKTPCEKLAPLKNAAGIAYSFTALRFAQERALILVIHDTDVAMMEEEHDITLFATVLAELARCRRDCLRSWQKVKKSTVKVFIDIVTRPTNVRRPFHTA